MQNASPLLHGNVNADIGKGGLPVVEGVECGVVNVGAGACDVHCVHRKWWTSIFFPSCSKDQLARTVQGVLVVQLISVVVVVAIVVATAASTSISAVLLLGVRRSVLSVPPRFPRRRHRCSSCRTAVASRAGS